MTSASTAVVAGFAYPRPDSIVTMTRMIEDLPVGAVRRELERFASAVSAIELGEREELHTRTLDLSPLFVPYVGHLVWGESYRRGAFMADLQRAQLDAGVDQHGELPDHIVPILGYLDREADPLPDLIEALPQAIDMMRGALRKAEPGNPYLHLLAAVAALVDARLNEGART